jgi:peptidyl-tRNA hydrolase, PTH1 family
VLGKERVMLLKPETYMNLSGDSVVETMQYFQVPIYKLTVVHDEIELPPAKIRIKTGGSDAGHNGLRSITERIGNDYQRLRIGVGRPASKHEVERYVLQDFPKSEWPWVEAVQEAIAENIELVASGRPEEFQNRVHLFLRAKGFDEPPAAPAN